MGAASLARGPDLPRGVVLGLLAAGAWVGQVQVLNHDVGWLLLGARRLIAGAQLYVDGFIDVNPPGILYWMAPAAAFSQWSGIAETRVLPAWVWLWTLGSLWLCDRVLRALFDAGAATARLWCVASMAFLFTIFPLASFDALPLHAIGQREHVVLLLLTPLVLLAAARARGAEVASALAAVAGACAGFALCAKPQYLACVAALELYRRLARRALRPMLTPELVALAAVGVLYVASLVLYTPAYLEVALPLALDTYWAYQLSLAELVAATDLIALAGAAAVAVAVRRAGPVAALAGAFATAAVSGYVAFLIGATGWPYHALPFRSYALAAVSCLLLVPAARTRAVRAPPLGRAAAWVMGAALVLVLVPRLPWHVGFEFRESANWKQITVDAWQQVIDQHAPGGPLLVFVSGLGPQFPVLNYAGVEWSSRFSCLWVLPALARARAGEANARLTPERIDAIERWLRDAVLTDFQRTPPALVLIDRKPSKPGFRNVPFDFLKWLGQDERFRRLWSGYQRAGELHGFALFTRSSSEPP
jgi:hypothetical protein